MQLQGAVLGLLRRSMIVFSRIGHIRADLSEQVLKLSLVLLEVLRRGQGRQGRDCGGEGESHLGWN